METKKTTYNFRPDGLAGKLRVHDLLELGDERDFSFWYELHMLSEMHDINYYYEKTQNGQKLLQELYIEMMHTPYRKLT